MELFVRIAKTTIKSAFGKSNPILRRKFAQDCIIAPSANVSSLARLERCLKIQKSRSANG